MALINRIKNYAKLCGMGLREVAKKAGLSENAIYAWKKHKPNVASIRGVAEILDVSYEALMGKEEKHEPKKIDLKATIDDDDIIMTFEGREIPKEDLDVIKRLLRRD